MQSVAVAIEHPRLDDAVLHLRQIGPVHQAVEDVVERDARNQYAAAPVMDGALRHLDARAVRAARLHPIDAHVAGQYVPPCAGRVVAEILHQEAAAGLELTGDAPFGRLDVALPRRDRLVVQLRRTEPRRACRREDHRQSTLEHRAPPGSLPCPLLRIPCAGHLA